MTIKQAAAQARKYPHGSLLYCHAFQVLLTGYRVNNPKRTGYITLDALWGWVNGYLEMEEAAHGPTPLG